MSDTGSSSSARLPAEFPGVPLLSSVPEPSATRCEACVAELLAAQQATKTASCLTLGKDGRRLKPNGRYPHNLDRRTSTGSSLGDGDDGAGDDGRDGAAFATSESERSAPLLRLLLIC